MKKDVKPVPGKYAVFCSHKWVEPIHHFWEEWGDVVNKPKTCSRCDGTWEPFAHEPETVIGYIDGRSSGVTVVWGPRYI
jgi:hypothetical protein